jgi:aubergine-like protein
MADIAETTRLKPQERLKFSIHLADGLNHFPSAKRVLDEFGFNINQEPDKVSAYNISGEKVSFKGNSSIPIRTNGNFQVTGELFESIPLKNWVIMRTDRESSSAEQFATNIHQKLKEIGIAYKNPEMLDYDEHTFTRILQRMTESQEKPQIVVVLLPSNRKRDYEMIKKVTTTTAVVVTQVVMLPFTRLIVEKVALQIQAKIGAQLWTLRPPTAFGEYLMVIGIDVFHDTKNRRQSVLGFCATIHPNLSKYYSTVAMHETGQEVATTIGNLFFEAAEVFQRKRGHYPQTVIFFRD